VVGYCCFRWPCCLYLYPEENLKSCISYIYLYVYMCACVYWCDNEAATRSCISRLL